MTEGEWLGSEDPAGMLDALASAYEDGPLFYYRLTNRKRRLFASACVGVGVESVVSFDGSTMWGDVVWGEFSVTYTVGDGSPQPPTA